MAHLFGFRTFDPAEPAKSTHKFVCMLKNEPCIGIVKTHQKQTDAGKQCPRSSVRGTPFCPGHLQSDRHLKIATSHLPGAGKGLFAFRSSTSTGDEAFAKGDYVIEYIGERIDAKELEQRYKGMMAPFAIRIENTNDFIDGACARGAASFANHSDEHANVEFVVDSLSHLDDPDSSKHEEDGQTHVYLQAMKSIKQCDEILVNYGKEYGKPDDQKGMCYFTMRDKHFKPDKKNYLSEKEKNWKFCEDGKSGEENESTGFHPCGVDKSKTEKKEKSKTPRLAPTPTPRLAPTPAPRAHKPHPFCFFEDSARLSDADLLAADLDADLLAANADLDDQLAAIDAPAEWDQNFDLLKDEEQLAAEDAEDAEDAEMLKLLLNDDAADEALKDRKPAAEDADMLNLTDDDAADEAMKNRQAAEDAEMLNLLLNDDVDAKEVAEVLNVDDAAAKEKEASNHQPFVKFKIRITKDLTSCLKEGNADLNIHVVNYYLQYLRESSTTADDANTWIAPCAFLKTLDNHNEDRYFTRTFKGLKRIVIPGVHEKWWYLIFVDLEKRQIFKTTFGVDHHYTPHVLKEQKKIVTWLNNNLTEKVEWETLWWDKYSKTREDSGVYACMLADKLLLSEATDEDPKQFRKKMYAEIWKQK